MKLTQHEIKRFLATGLLLISLPLTASAHPGDPEEGFPGPHSGHPGPPQGGRLDTVPPAPFLAGLKLSEQQQDSVFKIVHDSASALREAHKALHHAEEELRQSIFAPSWDAEKVRQLSATIGRATADIHVLRANVDFKIYALLTPEQRIEVEIHRKQIEAQEPDGHGDAPIGPRPRR